MAPFSGLLPHGSHCGHTMSVACTKKFTAMAWLRAGAPPMSREPWRDPEGALTASPGAHGQQACPQDCCNVHSHLLTLQENSN